MTPNVLLVVVDSLRADVAYSATLAPNIAEFRARGTAFRTCICSATTTTPAFASLLTGCHPTRHGVRGLRGYRMGPGVPTLAEAFSRKGYATKAIVTGPLLPETGVLRGFAEVEHRRPSEIEFVEWGETLHQIERDASRPCFTLLHIWEMHLPFKHPPDFRKRWDRRAYERVATYVDAALGRIFDAADNTVVILTGDHGERLPRNPVERALSWTMRKARQRLKTGARFPGIDRALLSRFQVGHGHGLFEDLINVPLAFAGPGVPISSVDRAARHIDVVPSLADLCDLPILSGLDGTSLFSKLEDGPPEDPSYTETLDITSGHTRHQAAVRAGRLKLVRQTDGRLTLFDVGDGGDRSVQMTDADPNQLHRLKAFLSEVETINTDDQGTGITSDEAATIEAHLRDLGYL